MEMIQWTRFSPSGLTFGTLYNRYFAYDRQTQTEKEAVMITKAEFFATTMK